VSLRARILLLVLLATIAPAAALAWYLFAQRDQQVDEARRSLGALAAATADDLNDKVSGTVQLLHGLSRAPDLDTPVKAACSDFLADVLARYPQYTGLLTITPAGDLHCDSLRTGRTLNVSARAYFKQATATRQPAFDVVFGGLTGIAVLQVAFPVVDGAGELKYLLLASLNLSQFVRSVVADSRYRETRMLLWSRDGTLMVREPEARQVKLAGRRFADSELFRFTARGAPGITAELTDPGGVSAIWALGVLPEPQGSGLRINLGLPGEVLVAEANKGLLEALSLLVGASVLALLGALLIAERGIRRHAARMMKVAARVGGGDLAARIGAPYPRGEIGDLMDVFDRTIAAVQVQRAALEDSGRDLRRSNRMLRVLSGINALIVRERDQAAIFRQACRIVVHEGQFRMAWIGLIDRSSMTIDCVAAEGLSAEHRVRIKNRFSFVDGAPMANTLAARAIAENRILYSNDTRNDPALRYGRELARDGHRAFAILPLAVSGEVTALLALYSEETGIFDDSELRLLNELAADVSFALEHIEKSDRLEYLARYDPLTGLANSAMFHERLADRVTQAAAAGGRLAVFVVDIERFKGINDTLGRAAGDDLLRQFAERLVHASGDASRFARVGADLFAAVSTEVRTERGALSLADRRIAQCLRAPFAIGDGEHLVSVKIGIAWFPEDGADAASLFRNAEAALKEAKSSGHRALFYTQSMTERVVASLSLERKLREALERDQFVLHYQPKVDVESRSVVGVEALIRWQSPELGLVPPMKFIPFLEESGLILPVGAWALKQAARDHRAWAAAGLAAPRIAVNVSALQLRQRDFVNILRQSILEGAAPAGVDLEVTESVLMEDIQGHIAKLQAIQLLGVRVAMDDFGTGYSSLAYLAKLPLQALKIDRGFIAAMLDNSDTMTLVSTMISLAHSLRLKVVAEGVETEEQARLLRLLRCDEIQGYLISRPLPMAQMLEFLRNDVKPLERAATA
jgi:diguanylate cyclase (GGDEF)-like protein